MALTEIPIELSSTPGIVDNSTSTAITIDSSGNVGIGTSSPDSILHLSDTGESRITFEGPAWGNYIGVTAYDNVVIAADENQGSATSSIRFRVDASERMRIDASGNVGIGVVPNGTYSKLQVKAVATSYVADFIGNVSGDSQLTFWNSNQTAVVSFIENQAAGAHMSIVAGSGRSLKLGAGGTAGQVLLDASGNLLVGKTATSFGTDGFQANADGQIWATNASASVTAFNRRTTDGAISVFYKDGTAVGSIGTQADDLNIGNADVALRFADDIDSIIPFSQTANADRGGAIDLGYPSANTTFKDLYLSGGVVLATGGLPSASTNKLDSYEEGTWTPTIYGAGTAGTYTYSNGFATYTKVGRRVTIGMYITGITEVSAGSDYLVIGGVPFAKMANSQFTGAIRTEQVNLGTSNTSALVEFTTASSSSSTLYIRGIQNNAGGSDVQISGLTSGSSIIGFSITYFTS
jgi:hypothetical protein